MEREVVRFVERVRDLSPERRNRWLRRLLVSFDESVKHGEEKLALATQTYDMVDRHIRRLDDDLLKFEEEQLVSPRVPGSIPTNTSTHHTGVGQTSSSSTKKSNKKHDTSSNGRGTSTGKRAAQSSGQETKSKL
jgi:hypothetical protein